MSIDRRFLAPVLAFVAVGAVGAGITLLGGSGSTRAPRLLHLAGTTAAMAAAPAYAPAGGSHYELTGTLPTGRPADAGAWTLSLNADPATVDRLAAALRAGPAHRSGSGWQAGGLVIPADGQGRWYWSPCAADTVSSGMSSGSPASGCAVAVPGVVVAGGASTGSAGTDDTGTASAAPPVPPAGKASPRKVPVPSQVSQAPLPPTSAQVLSAARPVFEALGLDASRARVDGWSAVLDPTVDGLGTSGFATRVGVGSDGRITDASGWLTATTKADTYPLVTARQAFDALPALPVMMMMCPVGPDGKGCVPPPPVQVTGAHLGLALRPLSNGTQVLLPAWMFEVKGSAEPVAGIAVQPAYLGSSPVPVPTAVPLGVPAAPPATAKPSR